MEIEVKAYLKNSAAALEKLRALGCELSQPKTQDDMVWAETAESLEAFLNNKVFLRIRIQDGENIILTAKKSRDTSGHGSLVKREHEVTVSSAEEVRGILEMLGLQEIVRTKKTRRTTHYNDYEICIDEVDELGTFIEVERIADEEQAQAIQEDMMAFLATLGVTPEDHVTKGYDILMLEKTLG